MEDIARIFTILNVNIAVLLNRLKRIPLVAAVSLAILVANAEAKQWRGITPLKSSRAEVESLLGKPNELGFYQIENDRAIIFYSEGQCENPDKCECVVPKDTVLKINVTFEYGLKLSKFNLDNGRYTKDKAPSDPQSTYSDLESIQERVVFGKKFI